jgi:hypothetical protein
LPVASPATDGAWYAKSLGLEFGPMPFGELIGMAARGVLTASDRVRQGTAGEWRPAGSFPSVSQALASSVRGEGVEEPASPPRASRPPGVAVRPGESAPSPSEPRSEEGADAAPADDGPSATRRPKLSQGVLKGVAALLVLAGAAALVLIPRQPAVQRRYDQLSGIHAEVQSLRERRAPDAEWAELVERVKSDVMPWAGDAEQSASSAARSALATAGREHLLPMLGESRRTPGPHEKAFVECLEEARGAMRE